MQIREWDSAGIPGVTVFTPVTQLNGLGDANTPAAGGSVSGIIDNAAAFVQSNPKLALAAIALLLFK